MLYAYSFGKRIVKTIGAMDKNVSDHKITFVINRVSHYTYEVGIKGCKHNVMVDIDFWYGYILKPYFGGNNPAVKHFNIDIEYHICERKG